MLFAALSCLQGSRAADAAEALLDAGAEGIQLTAGCAPDARLDAVLDGVAVRTHHGYHPRSLRTRVYGDDATLVAGADSLHPPRRAQREAFFSRLEAGAYGDTAFEAMYPGYVLGDEADLRRYLATGAPLAVDVSHIHLQLDAGVLSPAGAAAVYAYDHIAEIHVSRDAQGRDAHLPFDRNDYGISWARERHRSGADVVVECYVHHLSPQQRRAQFAAITDAVA
jgi:hypothetical protein